MKNRSRLIRKITNLCGITFIMLGMIPVPVLSQIGSVYAAEQLEDGAAAVDLPAFVSYTELLGSTSVKLDAVVEVIVGLPEISGRPGDWISLAILGPVLAEEGDDVVPTEEPPAEEGGEALAEEPPADEPPAEETPVVEETPTEEAPAEEPVCEEGEECASEEGEPLAEEEPVCEEGEECAPEGEEPPAEEEIVCEGEECAPEAVEEPAAENPEESLVEVVAALAEADVVLVDENEEVIPLVSEEAAEILLAPDPWFYDVGGIKKCYVPLGGTCIMDGPNPCIECNPTATPIQDAIDLAPEYSTIYIAAHDYSTTTILVDREVVLKGVQDETTDFISGDVYINTVNLGVNINFWENIFATIVNVLNDDAEIQDAVNIVNVGGTINVALGTYNEHVGINVDDITISGLPDQTGDTTVGAGTGAPVLDGTGIPAGLSNGFYVDADGVTIQGFTIQNFVNGVKMEISGNPTFNLLNNTIQNNVIGFYNENSVPQIHVNYNDFNNNSQAAIFNANDLGAQFTDATNNEWGCDDGPIVKYCGEYNDSDICIDWIYLSWSQSNAINGPVDITAEYLAGDLRYCNCQILMGSNDKWPIHLGSPAQSYKPFKLIIEAEDGPFCGNGIAEPQNGEECDGLDYKGSPPAPGATCNLDCEWEWCGDGEVNNGEVCDYNASPTGAPNGSYCTTSCTLEPLCGDGTWDPTIETCDYSDPDDTGAPAGQYCTTSCTLEPLCGDGTINNGEECDDGPRNSDTELDACRTDCTLPYCGDGIINQSNEECDGEEHCNDDCVYDPYCGDGIVQKNEECEPGVNAGCLDDCTYPLIPPPGVLFAVDRADLITAGIGHTCALTDTEGLECWGLNDSGQVGDSSFVDKLAPVDVVGIDPTTVIGLVSGIHHTCVLTSANDVYCWGLNSSGQLGDGTIDNSNVPVYVDGLEGRIISVSAGAEFTCALNSANEVFCWGNNSSGQLNDGTEDHSSVPVKTTTVSSDTVLISGGSIELQGITSDGAVQLWNSQPIIPVTGYPEDNNTFVAADRFTEGGCSMTNTGDVNCWGGITNAEVVGAVVSDMLASGQGHACTMKAEGLVCWGSNSNGQLGDDSTDDSTEEVSVVELKRGVIALAAGEKHTCVIYSDETVACWGLNVSGQLGNSTTDDSMVPVDTD